MHKEIDWNVRTMQGTSNPKYPLQEAMESSAFPDKIMMKLKQNVDIFKALTDKAFFVE